MDEAVKVKGVFIYSMNINSEFMIKCLQVLVNIFPELRITSIVPDELHFGFRVKFSSPSADLVLAKKHLIVSGEEVRIGSLRTLLTIHGVRKNGGEQFDTELHEAICNKFGKLVHVDRVPNSETWLKMDLRACVDVPELEELEIFNHEGYPEMFICLPSNNEMLTVTFHCRRCKSDGHVQQKCPSEPLEDEASMTDYTEVSNSSSSLHSSTPKSENSETSANEDFSSTASNFPEASFSFARNTAGTSSRNLAAPLKPPDRSVFFAPTFTTAFEITNTQSTPTTAIQVTNTTATPTTAVGAMNAAMTPPNVVEVTNTPPTPTSAVGNTNILSPRLQQIINMACEEINVIKRDQLEAFFFYVKNKSNPVPIAKMYTSNVGGLMDLLQRIISLFYNMHPPQASIEDDRFMKWLKGLVERFKGAILWRDSLLDTL